MPTFRNDLHLGHKVPLVETDDIMKGAVTTDKISDGAVTTEKIGDGEVKTQDIADDAVTTAKIGDGEVKSRNIGTGAVTTEKIPDGDITTDKIANGAVTTPKIADSNVTTDKIANEAVTTPKLANGAITTDKIPDGNVTTPKIADKNITTEKIAGQNVTTDKLADGAVTTPKIADRAVTTEKIADENVTTAKIADRAVTTPKLAEESITGDQIEEDAVVKGKIANDAVQTRNIKNQNVTNDKLKDHDISWDKLDRNVQNIITTSGGGSGPLSTEFGDSDLVGITQKTLTESRDNLQAQIDAIVSDKATVALTVSPSAVFADGEDKTVTFVATSSPTKATIVFDGGTPVEATRAEFPVVVNSATPTTVTKSASFTVAGISKGSKSATVSLVWPIYYGAGASDSILNTNAMTANNNALTDPSFTKNITTQAGDYLYFEVPSNMRDIQKIELYDNPTFPTELSFVSVETSRAGYKAFKTVIERGAGTHTYKIS